MTHHNLYYHSYSHNFFYFDNLGHAIQCWQFVGVSEILIHMNLNNISDFLFQGRKLEFLGETEYDEICLGKAIHKVLADD